MRRGPLQFVLILLLALTTSSLAQAEGTYTEVETLKASPWTQLEASYVETSMNKLGFGLLNSLTGWTALLWEPHRYDNKFTGLAKGAWRTITNTAGGALHVATFPFPIDIPLPDGGVHFE